MTEIVGIANSSFTGNDGTLVQGMTVYTQDDIDPKRGKGRSTGRFFLTSAKLAALDFVPSPGQKVEVFYNKYGKVSTLRLLGDSSADDGIID